MIKKKNLIYLRAHHLLCLQGYQGYGYNKKFEANMERILDILKNKCDVGVILTDFSDDVCKECSNLTDKKRCNGGLDASNTSYNNQKKIIENNNEIIKIDSIILKKSKLKKNRIYSYTKLLNIINNTFPNIEDVKNICGDCKWIDKCLWYQSKNNIKNVN